MYWKGGVDVVFKRMQVVFNMDDLKQKKLHDLIKTNSKGNNSGYIKHLLSEKLLGVGGGYTTREVLQERLRRLNGYVDVDWQLTKESIWCGVWKGGVGMDDLEKGLFFGASMLIGLWGFGALFAGRFMEGAASVGIALAILVVMDRVEAWIRKDSDFKREELKRKRSLWV
jgi:hypothetical protein